MNTLAMLAESSVSVPIGWALGGFGTLCGIVGALGKLIFSMCMNRIRALEKDVARLSRGCGVSNCYWKTHPAPDPD